MESNSRVDWKLSGSLVGSLSLRARQEVGYGSCGVEDNMGG